MMVRTIQHPGVQIQESEIGNYSTTVVMNNAYIMGFTDRGPIYDYSFISTTKEFTKIYGEPQSEAEKYLFIAVQSVLANGGTPIVARMPYDNKQCKAYKALKLKWIDQTDMIAPKINTDLASPVIPLSALTNEINMNKPFREIFTDANITVNGQMVEGIADEITLKQAVELLNPYKSGSAISDGEIYSEIKDLTGLKINGMYPSALNIDQEAVSSLVDSIDKDTTDAAIYVYKYDEGYNTIKVNTADDINNMYLALEHNVAPYRNRYLVLACNESAVSGIPHFDSNLPSSFAISLFDTVEDDFRFGAESVQVLNKDVAIDEHYASILSTFFSIKAPALTSTISYNKKKAGYVFSVSTFNELSTLLDLNVVNEDAANPVIGCIKDGDIEGYYDFDIPNAFCQTTTIDDLPVYTCKDLNNADFKPFIDNAFLANSLSSTDRFIKVFNSEVKTAEVWKETCIIGGLKLNSPEVAYIVEHVDTMLPIFDNTVNGYKLDANGDITDEVITEDDVQTDPETFKLLGFIQLDEDMPAISGTLTRSMVTTEYAEKVGMKDGEEYPVYNRWQGIHMSGRDSSANLVTSINVEKTYFIYDATRNSDSFGRYNSLVQMNNFLGESDVKIENYYSVKFSIVLKNFKVRDITDLICAENKVFVAVKTIYNNPAFLNIDEDEYTLLEAKLLGTPEMGFKYGLYLDSEDCEISNDQYDDLVTVNQFKAVDRSIDKYGQDIDDANFLIVDKQKTVVQGTGGNIGYFTAIIDPFDALKVQRTLVNPAEVDASSRQVKNENGDYETIEFDHSDSNIHNINYWAYESANAWNTIYDELLDSMDCLQRIRNADGIYIGEPNPIDGKQNILDSWSIPLTGDYYNESISKTLMKKFPKISMADISSEDLENPDYTPSIIDHNYATHVCIAVCKTTIDQSNGKIVVNLVETHFGSLFDEKNTQNGRSLFIGDIINANSDYIEFYRNDYVSSGDGNYAPSEYRRTDVNQIFIKDSEALKNAAQLRGIDYEEYGCDALDPVVKAEAEDAYYKDLNKYHIYAVDKKEVCIYNLNWETNLTSFSKKESQKVIANTTSLYSVNDGTTVNIANNFIIDMDRCIKFIKNIDDIPLHFVCDAGLSTIAQFCDNVIWNPKKKTVTGEKIDPVTKKKTGVKTYATTGGWITQPFDPDNDSDSEDRYITGYEDVATWRKVVEKLTSIASEIRKDCFAIIDAPRQLTLDGAAPKIRRSKFTNNFDKTIGKYLRYITGINSSYVAGYYNWLRTTDQYTGKSIWIPPTSKIIGNYCYLNINNLPWLAPAGLTYGIISGCYAVSHNPDPNEEDQIYMKSWNYIKQYAFDGLVVEGQKTLLGKESVFERINVRLLFLDLERYAYNVARTFKYQVNNSYTREQFVATLKPKFEDYTLRGGIYEYLIKVDDTNNTPETIDANELRGDIFIKPARLIEFVLLNFIGTSTAVDFTELQLG